MVEEKKFMRRVESTRENWDDLSRDVVAAVAASRWKARISERHSRVRKKNCLFCVVEKVIDHNNGLSSAPRTDADYYQQHRVTNT